MAPGTPRWLIARPDFAVQVLDPGDAPIPGQGNASPEFDPIVVLFEVPEDTPSTGFVGRHPYEATDAEDDRDGTTQLTYDLSGADADSFALALPGDYSTTLQLDLTPVQIAVKPVTHLDYETQTIYSFELGSDRLGGREEFRDGDG